MTQLHFQFPFRNTAFSCEWWRQTWNAAVTFDAICVRKAKVVA